MLNWILLVVGLLTALYWYMSQHHGYWRSQGVYTLPGAIAGVGHMWDAFVLKKSPNWIHCEMYSQYKGHAAVGIYSFRKPALLLQDPNLIQTVLIKEFSNFHDNAFTSDEKLDPHISRNPFVLKGQRWKTVRQQLSPAFSPVRIKVMYPLIQRVCQEFNTYMEKHQNEDVNVLHVTGLFTSEVVAKCAFGLDGNVFNNPNADFYQQGRKLWDSSVYSPFMMLCIQYFPIICKLLGRGFVPPDVTKFFTVLIKQAADYRLQNPDKVPDNDYLQFLLNLQSKDKDFTIDDVIAQSLTFFTDGFETSAVTASLALYELTINPELQEAVRQEAKTIDSFNYENINTLSLLDRVIQETLRKYSVFSLIRECTKDCELQAGGQSYPMLKGQHAIVPVYGIHHDPEIYPDPEKFDPDRFLPENIKNRHPSTFLGFGAGPRTCIGNRFATSQVKALMANMLTNFRLIKGKKTVDKPTISPQHILPVFEEGIWAQFQSL